MTTDTKKTLIKNGTLADGRVCDVLIENGLIQSVAPSLSDPEASIFDATSMIVMSGLVDLHTHLREPGKEDSETVLSGSRAGVKGGYVALSAVISRPRFIGPGCITIAPGCSALSRSVLRPK